MKQGIWFQRTDASHLHACWSWSTSDSFFIHECCVSKYCLHPSYRNAFIWMRHTSVTAAPQVWERKSPPQPAARIKRRGLVATYYQSSTKLQPSPLRRPCTCGVADGGGEPNTPLSMSKGTAMVQSPRTQQQADGQWRRVWQYLVVASRQQQLCVGRRRRQSDKLLPVPSSSFRPWTGPVHQSNSHNSKHNQPSRC